MNEYMLTWGLPVPALTQPELAEELEIAQKDGENFRTSIFAGTLVRARADCKRCEGACRLWFMDDSVADGCLPLSVCGPRAYCCASLINWEPFSSLLTSPYLRRGQVQRGLPR